MPKQGLRCYTVRCLAKRSWALQGCNPTRDSQVRRENRPGNARGRHASGVALLSADDSFALPCLRKPLSGVLCGVGFLVAGTVATLLALRRRLRACLVAHAIALAGNVDDLGMMQEAIEDGAGRGHVTDQLAPVLQRPDILPPRNPPMQPRSIGLRLALLRCWNWRNGAASVSIVLTEENHV